MPSKSLAVVLLKQQAPVINTYSAAPIHRGGTWTDYSSWQERWKAVHGAA